MAEIYIGNIKGPQGETGATGATGPQGNAATVTVGSTSTTAYGNPATVTNVGTENNAILNFVIPQGRTGETVTAMDNLALNTIETATSEYPQIQVGDTGKTIFGKIIKFFQDLVSKKVDTSAVVNNFTTTESGYVADARTVHDLKESLSTIGTRHQATLSGTLSTSYTTLTGSLILTAGTYFVYAAASTGGSNNACVGIQVMLDGTTICGNNNGNNALHLLTTSGGTVTVKAQGNASVSISADVRFSYILAVRIA